MVGHCPWCRTKLRSTRWVLPDRMFPLPGSFHLLRCPRCSTLVLENPPDDLEAYYPMEDYYSFQPEVLLREDPFAALVRTTSSACANLPTWLQTRFGSGASVLDVGCGSGAVLDLYRQAGWQTWGIELSAKSGELAKKRGHRILGTPFPEALITFSDLLSDRFHLLRMSHVLEHLQDPRVSLRAARSALRQDGCCLIEVPNTSGWLARCFGRDYWQLDPPRHLVLLSRPALAGLLDEEGFRIETWCSVSRPQGFARSLVFAVRRSLGLEPWFLGDTRAPRGYRSMVRLGRIFTALADRFDKGDSLQILAWRKTELKC